MKGHHSKEDLLKFFTSKSCQTTNTAETKIGSVCRITCGNNAAMVLITKQKEDCDYIRVSPLAVSPFENEIDKNTDILVPASKMPNGLPCLIEWWNDRPILKNQIDYVFGNVEENVLQSVKIAIEQNKTPKNPSKSLLIFRETEKAKGNVISSGFYEKYFNDIEETENNIWPAITVENESNDSSKSTILPFVFNIKDIMSANENLAMAAATSDLYPQIKSYLETHSDRFYVNRVEDGKSLGFTLINKDKTDFELYIINKNGKSKRIGKSQKGKLYIKDGLSEYTRNDKIEIRPI